MSAWGSGGLAKSCNALLTRVENNDPTLDDLVILPSKTFGEDEANRISAAVENKSNTRLKSLSASGHALPLPALKRLGSAMSLPHSNIVHLAVGDRSLGDHGAMALCSSLESSRGGSLESIDLEWKGLSVDAMAALGKCFGSSQRLRYLNLSRNDGIGDAGVAEFCRCAVSDKSVVPFPKLEYLDLSDCGIGPTGVSCLVECLKTKISLDSKQNLPMELKLSSNPLGPNGCASMSKLLRGKSALTSLSISKCEAGDEGIQMLSEQSIKEPYNRLQKLDISENGVGAPGIAALAKSLWHDGSSCWISLSRIFLAGNDLGERGVKYLAEALYRIESCDEQDDQSVEGNITIRELDLSQTCCGVGGADAIVRCGRLSFLRLFNNKLGSEGFKSLSAVLRGGHPSIESLDLGGNNADLDSVLELLHALTETTHVDSKLQVLEIGGNQCGDDVEEAIQKLQRVRPSLDVARDRPRGGQAGQMKT